jgi:hypothetical protein
MQEGLLAIRGGDVGDAAVDGHGRFHGGRVGHGAACP